MTILLREVLGISWHDPGLMLESHYSS